MERSKLVAFKKDLVRSKIVLTMVDMIEAWTEEQANTTWKFYTLTIVTVSAYLLRVVPKGCKDTVLTESLPKTHTVNCPTYKENIKKPYNDNLCFFKAVALRLYGNGRLKETSKPFNFLLEKLGGSDPLSFQGVCMEDIPIVEEVFQMNIHLCDIDLVHGPMIGELAKRNVAIFSDTVRLLRCKSHICLKSNINALFKACRSPSCGQFLIESGNLERHLTTCKEQVKSIFLKTCINLPKLWSTNRTCLASLIQTNTNSLTTWLFLIFTQLVWKMTISRKPKQQHGSGSTS